MNAASLRRFRWWIPVFVMLTPVLCSAQTADFPSCYYSYQGNGDEDAVVEFSVPAEGVIETATVRYRAGTGHCTSVKVHIYVDDVFVATTAYLPAGEYSQAFDVTYLLGGASGAVVTLEFDSCEAGVGCCEGPPYGSWAGWTCLEGTVAGNGCPELLGPTPYLWFEDSPFAGLDFGAFYFEDFEDHVMSLTNITLDDQNGMVSSDHPAGPSSIDSVDGDDGDPNDGGCSDCDAWWALGPYGVHVLFQEDDQGRLPTHAGVVWTDGEGLVSFNAYGNDSSLLGTIGPVAIADGSFNGTTAEDRFFGVICTDGISRVHISNAGGGMEIDHIQFGYSGTGGLSWTDVTSGQPLNDPRYTVGAAWGDYDGDGYHDLYLATTWAGTPDGENRLLRNNAGSGFTDVTDALLGNPDQTHGAVWGDYDNDGRLDLYLTNHDAANVLLRNEGAGSFTDVTTGPLGNTFDGSTATWADYDLDSLVDIYIGNNVDHERLLHNEGDGAGTNEHGFRQEPRVDRLRQRLRPGPVHRHSQRPQQVHPQRRRRRFLAHGDSRTLRRGEHHRLRLGRLRQRRRSRRRRLQQRIDEQAAAQRWPGCFRERDRNERRPGFRGYRQHGGRLGRLRQRRRSRSRRGG